MKVKDIRKIFKYLNPFYRINKRKNREIYFIILVAKHHYIAEISEYRYIGLCKAFTYAYRQIDIDIPPFMIKSKIPKFNRKFLNARYLDGGWWWDTLDCKSRLSAFEKLLTYYKEKI